MRLFSAKTFVEVLAAIFVNLTSGWFGVMLVAPGFFGVSSLNDYVKLLTDNIPFGIVGLFVALLLSERAKST